MNLTPHNFDMERALLGGIMHGPESYEAAAQYMKPEDFHDRVHSSIYSLMGKLHGRKLQPDFNTILEALTTSDNLERAGGIETLVNMLNAVHSQAQVENHARRLGELSLLRRTIAACSKTISQCVDGEEAPEHILDDLRAEAIKLSYGIVDGSGGYGVAEILQRNMQEVTIRLDTLTAMRADGADDDKIREAITPGIKTHFYDLDRRISGIKLGEVMTIAAVTAGGKSALAQTITHHVAVEHGLPVIYFTLEMPKGDVTNRLLSIGSKYTEGNEIRAVSTKMLEFPELTDRQWEITQQSFNALSAAPITVIDDAFTLDRIRHRIQRQMLQHRERPLIIIDHMHLIDKEVRRGGSDVAAAEELANRIKRDIAGAMGLPVIQLAQFNQDVYNSAIVPRKGQLAPRTEPQLKHLYGGSGIQKASDIILFVHYDDGYWPDQENWESEVIVPCMFLIKKNRSGSLGRIKAGFFKEATRFLNSFGT